MDCLEHVGKALFARYGIAVPRGAVVLSLDAARVVAPTVVVKAQVHAGGRGRAGGVRVCGNAVDAQIAVRELLGSAIAGFRVA
ncbi:hypothetical protein HY634_03785 [Candidatus Uhrbacteria bacterium]|nr:hypothetical protein [Candidatus Uhrbacteria bacterium]